MNDKEKLYKVKGFEDIYLISKSGKVFSIKSKRFLTPYRTNYDYIRLYRKNITYRFSIHRLLAINFIPNPKNLPVVDHIDDNPFNNSLDNLQWVSQKENIRKQYKKYLPTRNFKNCKLYKNNKLIADFKSVKSCCRYCRDSLNMSYATMLRYRKYKDYVIKV